jgi:hypothetical protein
LAELRRHAEAYGLDQEHRLTLEARGHPIHQVQERLAMIERFRSKELKMTEIMALQVKDLAQDLEGKGHYRPYIGKW